MPTYDNMIPMPTDILSDSQDDLLQNFQVLATAFATNHVPYNSGAPVQGVHTQVTLPSIPNVAIAAPTPTPIATANMWSAQSALTGTTELKWQRENNGTTIEWTGLLANANGWTRLPSGILLKWGQVTATGFAQPVLFPVGANTPAFITTFQVFVTSKDVSTNMSTVAAGGTTNLGFSVNCFGSNTGNASVVTFSYLAIGI